MNRKLVTPVCEFCQSRIDSVFSALDDEEVSFLSNTHLCNYYKRGQVVFLEGNHPLGLFCINKGRVKISQMGIEGREQIIRLAKAGDTIGYRALISNESYTATATALEDSRICIVPSKVFFSLLQKSAGLTANLMKLLAGDLKEAERKVTHFAQKSVVERMAEALLMLKEYYGQDDGATVDSFAITREEIARIVGTATETAIRVMTDLRKEGIINIEGKNIVILNRDALVKIANMYD
jgi:CRP/FNR family transcriptional regulator